MIIIQNDQSIIDLLYLSRFMHKRLQQQKKTKKQARIVGIIQAYVAEYNKL